MTTPQWRDDDSLLADLRQALAEAGPVTETMREAGRAAYSWRSIDDELELASLVFDSAVDAGPLVRDGAGDHPRSLVFEGPEMSLHLEVSPQALMGQLVPVSPGEVVVRWHDGRQTRLEADDVGMFSLSPAPDGTFRVEARAQGRTIVTEWISPEPTHRSP